MLRNLGLTAVVAGLCLAGASSSFAADVTDPASQPQDGWHIYWPTYLWAAGSNGTARTLPPLPEAEVDVSFGDSIEALKDLEAGLISTVFAHNDRLLLMGDVNWMRLSPIQDIALGDQSAELKFYSESLTLMGAVGYRLVDQERLIVDAYIGAKYWYMDNSAELKPALLPQNHVEEKQHWVDGVVGAQIRSDITDRVFVSVIGFAGTGGSQFYGDVYGGFGYQITEKWDAFAGYRAMHVERENDYFSYDVTQHGPLLGVAAKF
jgi:hypothetical protein